ncbi:hypothetical protein SEA_KENREY_254 [Streptomyces phage Kenrey]|nr:hypothetical protein SEA_KENREY_254 [Streptomyces phage Kenrey]
MFGIKKQDVDLTGWKYRIEPTGFGSGSLKQWRVYITDPEGYSYGSEFGLLDYCLVYGKNIDKAEKNTINKIRNMEIDRKSVRSNTL